jgi:hypothetical protein
MQGHVNLPFAIGSHRSCSFTSNSPWPCACVSWFSLSMCSGSSPDCTSGSTSGSFGGEAEDMILGVWVRAADTGLRRGSFGMLCWQMTTSEVREKDLCSRGYAALRQGASDWAAICFTIARTWELPTVWGKRAAVLFYSVLLCFALAVCNSDESTSDYNGANRRFSTQSEMRNRDHCRTGLPASCRFNIEACADLRMATLTDSRVTGTRRTVGGFNHWRQDSLPRPAGSDGGSDSERGQRVCDSIEGQCLDTGEGGFSSHERCSPSGRASCWCAKPASNWRTRALRTKRRATGRERAGASTAAAEEQRNLTGGWGRSLKTQQQIKLDGSHDRHWLMMEDDEA